MHLLLQIETYGAEIELFFFFKSKPEFRFPSELTMIRMNENKSDGKQGVVRSDNRN